MLARAMTTVRGWTILNALTPSLALAVRGGGTPKISWSQDGEDIILSTLLEPNGFFVDVGAHHPVRFSVTQLLYEQGWRGVNIDASPNFTNEFTRVRPEDINIYGLVGKPRSCVFYRFEDPAYSTTDEGVAQELINRGIRLLAEEHIHVRSLAEILNEVVEPQAIDLLSVDVEGMDLDVLESHDWERYSPKHVLVEGRRAVGDLINLDLMDFLEHKGFTPAFTFKRSILFRNLALTQ